MAVAVAFAITFMLTVSVADRFSTVVGIGTAAPDPAVVHGIGIAAIFAAAVWYRPMLLDSAAITDVPVTETVPLISHRPATPGVIVTITVAAVGPAVVTVPAC